MLHVQMPVILQAVLFEVILQAVYRSDIANCVEVILQAALYLQGEMHGLGA
jgi:hypothetical protein